MLVSPASAAPRFEIQWFHNDILITEDSFSPLEDIVNDNTMQNGMVTSEITFRGPQDTDDTVFSGNFYCQLAIDGNVTLTSPSSSLTLREHDDHIIYYPCVRTDIYSEASISCAGRIDPPPIMSTTADMAPTTEAPNRTGPTLSPDDVTISTLSPNNTPSPTSMEPTQSSSVGLALYISIGLVVTFGLIIIALIISIAYLLRRRTVSSEYIHS